MLKYQQKGLFKALSMLLAVAMLLTAPISTIQAYGLEDGQPAVTDVQVELPLGTSEEAETNGVLGSGMPPEGSASPTDASSFGFSLFGEDITPPAFASDSPSAVESTMVGRRQVGLSIRAQEEAYHDFVVVPSGAGAPTAQQVREGKGADENTALYASHNNSKYEAISTSAFTPLHGTNYDVYVILRDDAGNLSEPARVPIKSPPAAEFFADTYPQVGDAQPSGRKQVEIKVQVQSTDQEGKVYWVLLPEGATAPTIDEVGAGTASGGGTPVSSGSPEFAKDTLSTFLVTGAQDATAYDLYLVVGDTENYNPLAECTDVVELKITTPAAGANAFQVVGGAQHATLSDALGAVENNGTIKLLRTVNTVENIDFSNKTITFDLNGFDLNITSPANEGIKVINGTLAVAGSGKLNATGKLYGVWANNGTVTVDDAASSSDGIGVFAMGGANVTVRGNAVGQNNGVHANNIYTKVTVKGNVTSTTGQIQGAVYALGQAEVMVEGSVSADSGYGVHTSNSGVITVEGNVTASRGGAYTEGTGGSITIKGDLSSYNHCAVITSGSGGNITVDGTITPKNTASYVLINNVKLEKDAGVPDSTKPGYLKYSGSGAAGVVWVKDASGSINVKNAAELKDALGKVVTGGTIRLTADINYTEKIVVDGTSFTLDVGTFTLALNVTAPGTTVNALELKNSGDLALTGTGRFNINLIGGNASSGVFANEGSMVTVSSVKVSVATGSAFGVYAFGSGSNMTSPTIRVLGDIAVMSGDGGGCGAKTWGTGQIRIDGIMTASTYISLNSVYKAKDSGVMDGGYLKYAAEKNGPGIVWVKIASEICQIEDASGTIIKKYGNLPEAVVAATSDQTVKLLDDIVYERSVKVDGAIQISGKTLTFDLNGKNLAIRNPEGAGLQLNSKANVTVTGTGNLDIVSQFAALHLDDSTFQSHGNINAILESTIDTGIHASYGSTVNISKGSIIGVSSGIYTLGSDNSVAFGGPVTVNGRLDSSAHGVDLHGNYTGNTVRVSGKINVTSGLGAGIHVDNGGTVTVGSSETPVSVTSTGGNGIWTRQGYTTSAVTVYGDVTGKDRAIHATGKADIKVFGDVKSTSTFPSLFAVESLANSGDVISVNITGNVEGQNGVKHHGNGGTISVTGNVTATGSASDTVGVYASSGSVSVTGNVAAPNGIGARAGDNGQITIDGVLTGSTYVKFYYNTKTADDKTLPTTKEGYHTYKENSSVVWVKDGAPATAYLLTVQKGTGGGNYLPGTPVNITANPPAPGKVFDQWTTTGGGSFANASSASTTFTMPSGAVTVSATYKDTPVETYTLTVSGSYAGTSGAGQYAPGAQVSIHAGSRSNYSFNGWTSSGGGSFASAGSATTTFTMPAKNVTVTADWTYSGGGNGSSGNDSNPSITPPVASEWLERSGTSAPIAEAKEKSHGYALTRANGLYGVRAAAWAAFSGYQYWHDTMDSSTVQVRVYIKNPTAITSDLLVSGHVKGSEAERVKTLFEKYFANKVRTIHLDQTRAWGESVEVAAKVDLTGMDITKLCIYSYDKESNTYRRIEKPAYWVDTNGYLHFITPYAGEIVISGGSLALKNGGAK